MAEFVKVVEPVTGTVVSVTAGSVQAKKWAVFVPAEEPAEEPAGETSPDEQDGAPAGNASRDAWAEYAEGLGIEVPEDAKRDDIKALVEQHEQD